MDQVLIMNVPLLGPSIECFSGKIPQAPDQITLKRPKKIRVIVPLI